MTSRHKKEHHHSAKKTLLQERTCVIVEFDVGFSNALFIRGEGVEGLSWEKGLPLKNVKPSEWVWESEAEFKEGRFKILINDTTYEVGEDHSLVHGAYIRIHPKFSK